jgi:3-deoxy-D-manno-octulosonate 8-phosphate phosphatase (KDO 8-P phosphatase)
MPSARNAAASLKLMAFDIDGVMTDGRLYYDENGRELKAFHTLDGQGLRFLREAGLTVAIITGRHSGAVAARAADLGIAHLFQGVADKRQCLSDLLATLQIAAREAGYMGDDVADLPVMRLCRFSAAPANAHSLVQNRAMLVTAARGGEGAVREVCDFILAAQEKDASFLDCWPPEDKRSKRHAPSHV